MLGRAGQCVAEPIEHGPGYHIRCDPTRPAAGGIGKRVKQRLEGSARDAADGSTPAIRRCSRSSASKAVLTPADSR
jgi:hypothetical protein